MEHLFASPRFFYQLFIIHCLRNYCIPLTYFVLKDKTSSYVNAFRRMIDECAKLSETCFCPQIVYANSETGIHQAVQLVWPAAAVKGCLFHLRQA
jgi:hypothetical protein